MFHELLLSVVEQFVLTAHYLAMTNTVSLYYYSYNENGTLKTHLPSKVCRVNHTFECGDRSKVKLQAQVMPTTASQPILIEDNGPRLFNVLATVDTRVMISAESSSWEKLQV